MARLENTTYSKTRLLPLLVLADCAVAGAPAAGREVAIALDLHRVSE